MPDEDPGRARRLRRCGGVGGPHPAARKPPCRCWPGCGSRSSPDGKLELSGFDYEVSAQAQLDVDRRRGRLDPGAGPAARRDHPQPAAAADRPRDRRLTGRAELRHLAVHACRRCRLTNTRRCRRCRRWRAPSAATRSPPPSPLSRSPPAATTRCRCSPASGSRSRASRSRLRPPTATGWRSATLRLGAGRRRDAGDRAGAGPDAGRGGEVADGRRRGHAVAVEQRAGRGPDRPVRCAARRPPAGCSTASSRSTARCCPDAASATAIVDSAALTDAVRRVALVASRTSPIRLSFSADGVGLEAGGVRRGRGAGVAAGHLRGRAAHDRVQRDVPARRSRLAGLRRGPARVHRRRPSRRS